MDASKATYRQPCNWSKFASWVTVLTVTVFVVLSFVYVGGDSDKTKWAFVIIRWILILMLLGGLYYCPRYVEITPSRLIIDRLLTKKQIPVSEIVSAVPYQRTMNFVRTWGSGGLFGFWGWFRNQELGRFFVYATSLDQLVLVTLGSGRKYVISCENAQEMACQITLRLRK